MTTAAITPINYPLLNSIFVRPSLLEAKVTPEALSGVISTIDTDQLKLLSGRKAEKFAKRWAPLFVHNLLQGAGIDDEKLAEALNRAENRLKSVAGTAWAAAFRTAGENGIPPSVMISEMSVEQKKKLHAERKAWRETAILVEKELAGWAISAAEKIKASYATMAPSEGAVSLKKMAKFSPKA